MLAALLRKTAPREALWHRRCWRFLDAQGRAQERPVGVALDRDGALLVADDVGNTVWMITKSE